MTECTAAECERPAVTWLRFAGMGELLHVHVCAEDEAIDREWCDVVESGPLPCPERLQCGARLFDAPPPMLG